METNEPLIHLSFDISLSQVGDLMNILRKDEIDAIDISVKKSFNTDEFSVSLRNVHWSIRGRLESLFWLSKIEEVDVI
jgi:hypothetical protein